MCTAILDNSKGSDHFPLIAKLTFLTQVDRLHSRHHRLDRREATLEICCAGTKRKKWRNIPREIVRAYDDLHNAYRQLRSKNGEQEELLEEISAAKERLRKITREEGNRRALQRKQILEYIQKEG